MPLVTRPANRRLAPRRGAMIVELALVLPIFLTFIFGIFEYGRYILVLSVTTNVARDAARWASVHANDQRTADATVPGIPSANYQAYSASGDIRLTDAAYRVGNPMGNTRPYRNAPYGSTRKAYDVPFVNTYAQIRMGPVANMLDKRVVWVFPADTSQLYATPAKVLPKTNTNSWREAAFTERIAVQIVGEYRPILPSLLFKFGTGWDNDPLPISVIGLAPSEG